MPQPEVLILCLNSVAMLLAYFYIYPRFCGSDGKKIASNDLVVTGVLLAISGSLFWGTGQTFSLIWFSTNWFWFTYLSCLAIELPLMLWYFNKHGVWQSFKR